MFFINEIEATLFSLLIKSIGWAPDTLVRSSLANFNPPKSIFQQVNPQQGLIAMPVLVHMMLLFYTTKKLLNNNKVYTVIQ